MKTPTVIILITTTKDGKLTTMLCLLTLTVLQLSLYMEQHHCPTNSIISSINDITAKNFSLTVIEKHPRRESENKCKHNEIKHIDV